MFNILKNSVQIFLLDAHLILITLYKTSVKSVREPYGQAQVAAAV